MLTQNQITRIREFFSTNVTQMEFVDISCESYKLLKNQCIDPSSIYALEQLWRDVEHLSESSEEKKSCCKCC